MVSDNQIKLSIIIPVYNKSKYLRECLESVASQTLKEIEIIIIDDGSTDNSAEICKQFLTDPRVKYIYQSNAGPAAARQKGIDNSLGEYIGFVDADDWIDSDMYAKMYQSACDESADIVMCGMYKDTDRKTIEYIKRGVYDRTKIEREILPKSLAEISDNGGYYVINWSCCTRIFSRNMIQDNHICFDNRIYQSEDLQFLFAATLVCKKYVSICNEFFYHYRFKQNSVSLSRSYIKRFWYSYSILLETLYLSIADIKYEYLSFNMHLCTFFLSELVVKNEYTTNQLKKKDKVLKLDELAQSKLIKKALQFVPKDKLNSHYRIIFDALMCDDGGQMYRYLKKNKAYVVPKENRRIIIQKKLKTVKRKALKYKAIARLNDKVRHRG